MKLTLYIAKMLVFFALLSACNVKNDSVTSAKEVSSQQAKVSEQESKFLIEMTDARLMDYQEGKLAAERGQTPEIRSYGRLMMSDQKQLLEDLKQLAHREKVALPKVIGADKSDGLAELKNKQGKEFDQQFISMITIDHERDVREFKAEASRSERANPNVLAFAQTKLPLIESHLAKIREIKKTY